MTTVLMLLTLSGCGDEDISKASCDGRSPADGAEVALQLTELGYVFIDTGTSQGDTYQSIIRDDADWAEQTSIWGSDGGLTPDFTAEAIFVNAWVYGGCGEAYTYGAWQWDDTLRVRASYASEDTVCDGYMPQVDLMSVPLGEAEDIGWCE